MLRKKLEGAIGIQVLNIYAENTFQMPGGEAMKPGDFEGAKAALYVISRKAGKEQTVFRNRGIIISLNRKRQTLGIFPNIVRMWS